MQKHEELNGRTRISHEAFPTESDSPGTGAAIAPLTPLLLTEVQAAALLNISQRKVWELAACGAIPSIKIGAAKRFRRSDLEDWVRRGCPTEKEA